MKNCTEQANNIYADLWVRFIFCTKDGGGKLQGKNQERNERMKAKKSNAERFSFLTTLSENSFKDSHTICTTALSLHR